MKMLIHEQTLHGVSRKLHLSEPVIHADNEAVGRSGHLGHAMADLGGGKIIAFSANTTAKRKEGHSAFGYVEYRISEDYGESFDAPQIFPFSYQMLMEGIYTVSVEKAIVLPDGTLVAFCLMNSQSEPICCEPWITPPRVVRSHDGGKSWGEPTVLSSYNGRLYDVLWKDGTVYALEFCNDAKESFLGSKPEHLYRLFVSEDGCKTFTERSVVPFDTMGRGYGNMIFTEKGELIAYAYDGKQEDQMDYAVSRDNGKTWEVVGKCYVKNKIRNPQVGLLDGQYILHGRAGESEAGTGAFVIYTSADGICWDDGCVLVEGRPACFYSENLTVTLPNGKERMLVKYSENYRDPTPGVWSGCVNSMMLFLESVD